MKGRILRRRTRARASAGFSLIELMVVVMLIALLAMLAAPSMLKARSDRLAFSYARDVSSAIHNGRARSAGRGSAHLVAYKQTNTDGDRGTLLVFEALDGTNAASKPPGPNPASGCRKSGQWAFAGAWTTPGSKDAANLANLVDAVNVNANGAGEVVVQEDIRMVARFGVATSADPPTATLAFVLCTTPNGTTYFGKGDTIADAITAMQGSTTPFSDVIEVDVARHSGGAVQGLNRRVIVAGAGAPRIKSE